MCDTVYVTKYTSCVIQCRVGYMIFFLVGKKKVYDMEHFHDKHVLLSKEACFPRGSRCMFSSLCMHSQENFEN